jgi:hypothetical protein
MRCPISKTRLLDSFKYAAGWRPLRNVCWMPITERLLDIETRLTAAKPTDIERPVKISLREFSSKLLGEIQHHSPRAARDIEKFRAVRRSSVK